MKRHSDYGRESRLTQVASLRMDNIFYGGEKNTVEISIFNI